VLQSLQLQLQLFPKPFLLVHTVTTYKLPTSGIIHIVVGAHDIRRELSELIDSESREEPISSRN